MFAIDLHKRVCCLVNTTHAGVQLLTFVDFDEKRVLVSLVLTLMDAVS